MKTVNTQPIYPINKEKKSLILLRAKMRRILVFQETLFLRRFFSLYDRRAEKFGAQFIQARRSFVEIAYTLDSQKFYVLRT
jgi:hypothetical protein